MSDTSTLWSGCATVLGRAHQRGGRPNQDAGVVLVQGAVGVAVVSDGCSSGRHSELGAGVGARVAAAAAARRAAAGEPLEALPARVLEDWTRELERIVRATSATEDLSSSVHDAWLATLQVAIARDGEAVVFGVGDGVLSVDGRLVVLEQGDAPDYPAYALFPAMPAPRLVVHHLGAFQEIVLATDGALGFERELLAIAREPRLRTNASLLQKKLHVLRDATRAPEDDCTVAVLRADAPWEGGPCA